MDPVCLLLTDHADAPPGSFAEKARFSSRKDRRTPPIPLGLRGSVFEELSILRPASHSPVPLRLQLRQGIKHKRFAHNPAHDFAESGGPEYLQRPARVPLRK